MALNPPLTPADEISVAVEADSAGDVATEGKGVHPKKEETGELVVELVEAGDVALGVLKDDPADWTGSQGDFSADDDAGRATMYLGFPVFNVEVDSGYTPSLGDYVRFTDGGDLEQHHGPTATAQTVLEATQTQDVGSISSQDTATFDITVTGVTTGTPISVSPPSGINVDLTVTAYVSAADTVTVVVSNPTSGSIDPSSGDYTVRAHPAGLTNPIGHDGSSPAALETLAGSDSEIDLTGSFSWGRVLATVATEFNVGSGRVAVARMGSR